MGGGFPVRSSCLSLHTFCRATLSCISKLPLQTVFVIWHHLFFTNEVFLVSSILLCINGQQKQHQSDASSCGLDISHTVTRDPKSIFSSA